MKVARKSFLAVLVGVLLLTIFFTLHTLAASKISPKTSIHSLSPATSIQEKVVNADGGVYWRSDPDWNTPITLAHQGVYTGDTLALACYIRGSMVPPYNNNPLWYWAEVVSGHGQGSGWVNDHFLNTGTNQPNNPVTGVDSCPDLPYIWSHTSDGANLRSLPEDTSPYGYLDQNDYLDNGYERSIDCWIAGGWMTGDYGSNIWYHVQPQLTAGGAGYIHASVIANLHTLPQCPLLVTLARGPRVSSSIDQYAITLSGFPPNLSVSVVCYDSAHTAGFSSFTMTTDGMGNGSNGMGIGFDAHTCVPASPLDGPDHWVVVEGLRSNTVQWGGGNTNNPPPPTSANVTLAQGPVSSGNIYRYVITLSGFPANTSVSVECYDSVSPSGFFHFTITTDGSGNTSTQNECYSGDGPDHWVVAGGVTSNHVQWGGGSTNNPPPPTPTTPSIPTPSPIPTTPPSQPVDAYSNYGPANTGYPICRGDPNNSLSMPGGMVSQTFTVPTGVASLSSALVQIDPDSTVTAHMSLAVNGSVVATADAVAAGDTQFWFGPVSVSEGDVITLSISFTATYGKIITVYTAGSPGGTFITSDSCPDGASNVSLTNTGLRARVSGMS